MFVVLALEVRVLALHSCEQHLANVLDMRHKPAAPPQHSCRGQWCSSVQGFRAQINPAQNRHHNTRKRNRCHVVSFQVREQQQKAELEEGDPHVSKKTQQPDHNHDSSRLHCQEPHATFSTCSSIFLGMSWPPIDIVLPLDLLNGTCTLSHPNLSPTNLKDHLMKASFAPAHTHISLHLCVVRLLPFN